MAYKNPDDPRRLVSKNKHYENNRDAYKARAMEHKQKVREFVRAAKEAPCVDCGCSYPYYVMQFDHVRGEKIGNLNRLATNGSLRAVIAEIEKCDLVCANCHAIRTFERLGTAPKS